MDNAEKKKWAGKARAILDKAEAEGRDLTTEERAKADRFIALAKAADDGPTPTVPTVGDSPFGSTGGNHNIVEFVEGEGDYSLVRAIRAAATGQWDGAEREGAVSNRLAERMGQAPGGKLWAPLSLIMAPEKRAGELLVSTEGEDIVPTAVGQMIGALVNKSAALQLGATVVSGLTGNVSYPRQSNVVSVGWVDEGAAVSQHTPTYDAVALEPSTVGAYVTVSNQALLQASGIDLEGVLKRDLGSAVGRELDRAVFFGSGSGAEPQGIRGYTGVNNVEIGTDGGAPTWSHIVDMEKECAIDNALDGRLGFVTNAQVKAKLLKTLKFGTDNEGTVWADGPTPLNGYRAVVTQQIPANLTKGSGTNLSAIIFGNWQEVIIAQWGALSLLVDPYVLADQGLVRILVHLMCQIELRHPESFCVIDDIVTT